MFPQCKMGSFWRNGCLQKEVGLPGGLLCPEVWFRNGFVLEIFHNEIKQKDSCAVAGLNFWNNFFPISFKGGFSIFSLQTNYKQKNRVRVHCRTRNPFIFGLLWYGCPNCIVASHAGNVKKLTEEVVQLTEAGHSCQGLEKWCTTGLGSITKNGLMRT